VQILTNPQPDAGRNGQLKEDLRNLNWQNCQSRV